jgi:hypothetical protein
MSASTTNKGYNPPESTPLNGHKQPEFHQSLFLILFLLPARQISLDWKPDHHDFHPGPAAKP